ncbi:MAG: esterase [Planctomycetota bacterium]
MPFTTVHIFLTIALCANSAADADGTRRVWQIEGIEREAIVHFPTGAPHPCPVILAFHGHGGRAQSVERSMHFQTEWPEAVVVYPQGLATKSARVDPAGVRAGWQNRPGENDDRDLKLVDQIMASLRAGGWVDDTRIYVTGHSNGGGFTYALWLARAEMLAAVAPVAGGTLSVRSLDPLPCMHVAGRADTLVPFINQERVMAAVRVVNGCAESGTPWAKDCTFYASKFGTPMVAMITDGGHQYPREAPALIVRFLKGQVAPILCGPPSPGQPWPRSKPISD